MKDKLSVETLINFRGIIWHVYLLSYFTRLANSLQIGRSAYSRHIFFWGGTGFWTQNFNLDRPALYCLSLASSPLCSCHLFIFAVLRIELRALWLLDKHSTAWAMSPVLLWLFLRLALAFLLGLAWTTVKLFMHPTTAGMTGMCHCTQIFIEIHLKPIVNFLPRLALNHDLPCAISQVVRITDMSHCAWLSFSFFWGSFSM
jgi:hypothetical protein